ncbi:prolyl oligopeptidase family serine peptidase [Azotosporobacter soli]|uniref:carboxylesterase family protein n=1 Tax=Azotosporobacter soli TaxID=3055040 RepID=UPI0031FE548F
MKKLILIVVIFAAAFACLSKETFFPATDGSQTAVTAGNAEPIARSDRFVEKKAIFRYKDQTLQYLLIFPAQYTQTSNRWPLILFLHGSSLRGQNLDLVKEYGPTWLAEQRNDFPFVVLAPQCPENDDWLNKLEILAALLDEVLPAYRIDPDRVYLTGTSLGGRGTWALATQRPDYFAAIVPLAAAKPLLPTTWPKQMLTLPVWAFHGENDRIAPLENHEALLASLRSQGAAPRLTILPNQGHNIAGIYKNQEIYDWLLSQKRASTQ